MDVRLIALSGPSQGQAVQVKAAKFFIGSHLNCQLRPAIPDLGGVHALIEQRDGRIFVRDFGTEGGTTVNDRVLRTKEHEVFNGDSIHIGPMALTLAVLSRTSDTLPPALAVAPQGWPFDDDTTVELVKTEPASFIEPPKPAARPSSTARALPTGDRVEWRSSLSFEMVGDLLVITLLTPVLTEEDTTAPMRQELREILEHPWPRREVIDMGKITYVSSRAVGVLLAHYQGILRQGGTMRLCRVNPRVLPIFEQMRVHMLIDIFPTLEEAVQTEWE